MRNVSDPLKLLERATYGLYVRLRRTAELLLHPDDWLPFQEPDILQVETGRHPEANFSIHMVLCHRDVNMALWCLKSFLHFAGISPVIMIHDDGTLDSMDKARLHQNLQRCTVIDRPDADNKMAVELQDYSRCLAMRAIPRFHCALKLFDPFFHAPHDVFMLMDSDMLFFQTPLELLDCAERGQPCFNSDYQNAYSHSLDKLSDRLGVRMLPRVNAGLMVLTKAACRLDFMENYFQLFSEPIKSINVHEQTLNAALLSRVGAHRLGAGYQISRRRITTDTVSHHFVNDGSRALFYKMGVRTLVRHGFVSVSGQSSRCHSGG